MSCDTTLAVVLDKIAHSCAEWPHSGEVCPENGSCAHRQTAQPHGIAPFSYAGE